MSPDSDTQVCLYVHAGERSANSGWALDRASPAASWGAGVSRPALLHILHHEVDRMVPRGIIVAAEVVGLPIIDLSGLHVIDLICETGDEIADAIHPCHEHLIGAEALANIQIAAVTVVQIVLLGFELVDERSCGG